LVGVGAITQGIDLGGLIEIGGDDPVAPRG
jgi:hypothetical protein